MNIKLPVTTFPHNLSWWTKWADVCVVDYGSQAYILQMKRNRLNKIAFRSPAMKGRFSVAGITSYSMETKNERE